jgi:hypothetical protein
MIVSIPSYVLELKIKRGRIFLALKERCEIYPTDENIPPSYKPPQNFNLPMIKKKPVHASDEILFYL